MTAEKEEEEEEKNDEMEGEPLALIRRGYVTVGIVGDPNMGKSSLLNTIFGRKKVSVSTTPGHTKHLQTHFYNHSLVSDGVLHPLSGELGIDT